ncbi:MAG: hypothetical protein WA777_02825 [Rhodanobacter sp.]
MTDRLLPHASAVANRAINELITHGEQQLADELAGVHRVTCDLVQAVHAEREAPTHSLQSDARSKLLRAEAHLRDGRAA